MVQHVTADVDTIQFDHCSPSLSSDGKVSEIRIENNGIIELLDILCPSSIINVTIHPWFKGTN